MLPRNSNQPLISMQYKDMIIVEETYFIGRHKYYHKLQALIPIYMNINIKDFFFTDLNSHCTGKYFISLKMYPT